MSCDQRSSDKVSPDIDMRLALYYVNIYYDWLYMIFCFEKYGNEFPENDILRTINLIILIIYIDPAISIK